MATTFNVLDLIFFAFTVIFVATAFFRGLVKELFALCGWLISFLSSYLLAPIIADFLAPHFTSKTMLDILMQIVVFIAVFIIFSISTSSLCDDLKSKMSRPLDRSLGVLYGLIKTLIVFGFIYAVAINVLIVASGKNSTSKADREKHLPAWFKDAKSHNLIMVSGEMLDFPVKKLLTVFVKSLDKKMSKMQFPNLNSGLDKKIEELDKNALPQDDSLDQKLQESGYSGYSKKDLEKMNHLIEIIDNK